MRIAFKTFGCRANSTDTDALYLEARRRGYEVVADDEIADAYVINTCTVTENADRDARQQAFRFKRQNSRALVAMVGCYAQVAVEALLRISEIDFIVGTADKFKILDYFSGTFSGLNIERNQVHEPAGFLPERFPGSRQARATIKVQDGCNCRCSFCIIPMARGKSRSLPLKTVVEQVADAYAQGFNEVVLTGIHLAHYGWDRNTDLLTLLRTLLAGNEGPRIRLSSLDPFEIDAIIDMLGREERLCPHLHIALQSGSNKILGRMRRLQRAGEFIDITNKIAKTCPDAFIGVDVIAGFPGEGEVEFAETIQCLKGSYWARLHVFSFSSRGGTEAAMLGDQVPSNAIFARSKMLRNMSEARYHYFLDSQIGRKKQVLLEKPSKQHPGMWLGHTENYLPTLSLVDFGVTKQVIASLIQTRKGDRVCTRPLKVD